jgi:tetratricopeptide (TPR) repeat protein
LRFFNIETLVVALAGGAGLFYFGRWVGDGRAWAGWVAVGIWMVIGLLPMSLWVQDKLIELYADMGWHARALKLAQAARDGAPTRRLRDLAEFDVALIHLSKGDIAKSRDALRRITRGTLKPGTRALADAYLAYALALLGESLEEAAELSETALRAHADDAFVRYVRGRVRLARGDRAGAREDIEASLKIDPDPDLPAPGERQKALDEARA